MKKIMLLLLLLFGLLAADAQNVSRAKGSTQKKGKGKKGKYGKNGKPVKLYNPSAMRGIEYKPLEFKQAAQQKKGGAIVHNGKKVVGNIRSVSGFRICIYQGIDRKQAIGIKQKFMTSQTKWNSYISYHRPNYHIRIGDFETKKQAEHFLRQLQKDYPGCYVAPDIVTIKNLEVKKARRRK